MSYSTQARMARDSDLLLRIAACASTQGMESPESWAWGQSWAFSAQPGWDAAYAYAVNSGTENPGNNEGVITDAMILSDCQSMHMAQTPTA